MTASRQMFEKDKIAVVNCEDNVVTNLPSYKNGKHKT